MSSGGSNLAPTNKNLLERVKADVQKLQAENPNASIPVDLVTASGSGLDPDISPAAAEFQIPRVAHSRGMKEEEVRALVQRHTKGRDLGFLGEPRVNVLELNVDLDSLRTARGPSRLALWTFFRGSGLNGISIRASSAVGIFSCSFYFIPTCGFPLTLHAALFQIPIVSFESLHSYS